MLTAIDTETTLPTGDEPVPRLVCVSVAGPSGCGLFHVDDPAARAVVRHALATGAVFANAPFDLTVIWRQWPDMLPEIFDAYEGDRICDVLVREKLIDIADGARYRRGGYGLAAVASRRAGIELAKGEDTWRLHYGALLPYPVAHWPEAARSYAIRDAAATLAVWLAQEQADARRAWLARGTDILADQHRQSRGHLALYLQSLRGIDTDPAQVARVDARLAAELAHHTGVCLAHGLARLEGVKKPKVKRTVAKAAAMLVAFCGLTGQPVPRNDVTAKAAARGETIGAVSLDEDAMAELRIPDGHPLASFRALGSIKTQRKGWIGPLSSPVIRTKYDELVETGRTASGGFGRDKDADKAAAKGRTLHPWATSSRNLQNFPQEGGYRECLVPPPGCRFVVSDFKGAELVTLAQAQLDHFGRSALADAIIAGRDPHAEYAATLLHIRPEDFDGSNAAHKAARKLAKAWNFGKPGGMGAERFIHWALSAYGVEVTRDEERRNTAAWKRQWPEMQAFFDRTSGLKGRDGFIDIVLPRSDRVRGGCMFPDACNTQFQGPAADAAKDALWRLLRAQYDPRSPMFGGFDAMRDPSRRPEVYQCLFVHDENVTVAQAARAADVRDEQSRIMVRSFGRWCPQVPVGTEDHIIERYAKV